MQSYFYELADFMQTKLKGDEVFTCSFSAEDSSFVRFNNNSVRQAGDVMQRDIGFSIISGQKHAGSGLSLSGQRDADRTRVTQAMEELRELIPHLPDDPHLLYSTEVKSSETLGGNKLPATADPVHHILDAGRDKDMVGLYAAGGIHAGFANSLGQRNWFSNHSFNLDWSLYHREDKAVKSGYAGFEWDEGELENKMRSATDQLSVLSRTPRSIDPGHYRVYLSPTALYELLDALAWGGFGLKDHRTKQTTLLRMVEEGAKLSPKLSISENTAEGVAPNFESAGFIKPSSVPLIDGGCFRNCLASPRSAKEYDVPTNGASYAEAPESVEISPGALPSDKVVEELGTGLYINNLHYLNYSDRPNCRITGMTRFATFWVESGQITAPVNVMRFDETIYRMFGDKLVDLTAERDFLLSSETYGGRSTHSGRLPGALIEEFTFTL